MLIAEHSIASRAVRGPRALPRGLARLGRLPEGEVAGVALRVGRLERAPASTSSGVTGAQLA